MTLPETDSHQNTDFVEDIFDFQLKSLGEGAKNCIITAFIRNCPPVSTTEEIVTLGSNIRKYRVLCGFSQLELARTAGVALSGVIAYEKDRITRPDPVIIQKIAKALQVAEIALFPDAPAGAKDAIDVLCPPVSFGSRIRNLRLRKGFQQKELAEMLGIHKVSLCRYEKDLICPDKKTKTLIENNIIS